MPIRPTSFIAPMCAMPTTTVEKMIGAISIFTSLMKPSPSGRMAAPCSGATNPSSDAGGDADQDLDVEALQKGSWPHIVYSRSALSNLRRAGLWPVSRM